MAMNIDAMVNRFLAWPLPDSVRPDGTYPAGEYRKRVGHTLVGTNLLTADEARQMFEHCLAEPPPQEAPAPVRAVCSRCNGAGIVPIGDGYSVNPCPLCADTRRVASGEICHCTCHNDPLYCRECKECSCHTK